jgi:NAD+ synthase
MKENLETIVETLLSFEMADEVERIKEGIRSLLKSKLRKRGLVVAISGGIDSSVCAALGVLAVGSERVFGLIMPEADSSPESLENGKLLVEHLGIEFLVEDVTPVLEAIGCYRWRDEAIRRVFPDYLPGWRSKIAIAGGMEGGLNHFNLIVQDEEGRELRASLRLTEYLQIVAATNFKQRIRKTMEFFHADRLNYAVMGTPNRAEYDQGFFVKNGDGSGDLKPIAHLYKTQVYMLARHLGLPEQIRTAQPTTDTYSLPQGQDEFFYALPYREMDVALWYLNEGKPAAELARVLDIDVGKAELVYQDIRRKRRTTAPLHWPALLLGSVPGPTTTPE